MKASNEGILQPTDGSLALIKQSLLQVQKEDLPGDAFSEFDRYGSPEDFEDLYAAAGVVLLTPDGRIILGRIRQDTYSNFNFWGPISGSREPIDNSSIQTALREVHEELGSTIDPHDLLPPVLMIRKRRNPERYFQSGYLRKFAIMYVIVAKFEELSRTFTPTREIEEIQAFLPKDLVYAFMDPKFCLWGGNFTRVLLELFLDADERCIHEGDSKSCISTHLCRFACLDYNYGHDRLTRYGRMKRKEKMVNP